MQLTRSKFNVNFLNNVAWRSRLKCRLTLSPICWVGEGGGIIPPFTPTQQNGLRASLASTCALHTQLLDDNGSLIDTLYDLLFEQQDC